MSEVLEVLLAPEIQIEITTGPDVQIVEVGVPGLQGPPGAAAQAIEFVQSTAAAQWTINHNLGRRPFITICSPGGAEIEASILHLSSDQTLVEFNAPTAGIARYL